MTEEKKKINQLRGLRVREARKNAGLTQAAFAELIHCNPNYISMIERGDRGLTLENADLISKICGVSSDYLLLRSEYKKEETIELTREQFRKSVDEVKKKWSTENGAKGNPLVILWVPIVGHDIADALFGKEKE